LTRLQIILSRAHARAERDALHPYKIKSCTTFASIKLE